MNYRVLEVMACGACLVTDFSEDSAFYFEPGRHFAVFSTPEEVVEKVAALAADDQARRKMAQERYEKVVSDFSFDIRVRTLMDDYALVSEG